MTPRAKRASELTWARHFTFNLPSLHRVRFIVTPLPNDVEPELAQALATHLTEQLDIAYVAQQEAKAILGQLQALYMEGTKMLKDNH